MGFFSEKNPFFWTLAEYFSTTTGNFTGMFSKLHFTYANEKFCLLYFSRNQKPFRKFSRSFWMLGQKNNGRVVKTAYYQSGEVFCGKIFLRKCLLY